jgi:hypothetical protein
VPSLLSFFLSFLRAFPQLSAASHSSSLQRSKSYIMAANYWASTQHKYWQSSKQELAEKRKRLEDDDRTLVQQYPLPERRFLSIYFNQRKTLMDLATITTKKTIC